MAIAVPLLVAAFTVTQPEPLPPPRLEPSFDQTTAVGFATEFSRRHADRTPGSPGARRAAEWVSARLDEYGLETESERFSADVAGLGEVELVNVIALVPGRTPDTIVVMAHRDNLGRSVGANDNASGTAALLELARNAALTPPAHTLAFLSTDGGAYGGLGAARFAEGADFLKRRLGGGASVVAVVNLDSLAGDPGPAILFGGETARSAAPALVATADASLVDQLAAEPRTPAPLAQLVDLAFPFSLYEQAPFVARGTPAVTLTTAGDRPPNPETDRIEALDGRRLGAVGRSAQRLVGALDESAEVARGTQSYVYFGSRLLRGWTIQFFLLVALLPFLAAVVDLFARCRRRHIAVAPALRSFASRLGVWLWGGAVFALLAAAGLLVDGAARPINPETEPALRWPLAAVIVLCVLSALAWLAVRPRLVPRQAPRRRDELGGHLAAMLVLAVVALVVAAINPYALIFVLPSLHAWLWVPHVSERALPWRAALYAAGFAGPLLLFGSFAWRYDLGFDAAWYVPALVAVGYVTPALALAALAWGAAAAQVGALTFRRYAPYPPPEERPARGPVREAIRRAVLARRSRESTVDADEPTAEVRSLHE